MSCDYCGCPDTTIVANIGLVVLRCNKCGLVYLNHSNCKELLETFYTGSAYHIWTSPMMTVGDEVFYCPYTRRNTQIYSSFILANVDIKGKRILEVGSCSGSLLNSLETLGAKEVVGIELNKENCEYANKRGCTVFDRPIEELKFDNEFDIVVMFHTLEHVYSPTTTIQGVYRALKMEGSFIGEVPHDYVYAFEHLYYFDLDTLDNYLHTWGFKNIKIIDYERYISASCGKVGRYLQWVAQKGKL